MKWNFGNFESLRVLRLFLVDCDWYAVIERYQCWVFEWFVRRTWRLVGQPRAYFEWKAQLFGEYPSLPKPDDTLYKHRGFRWKRVRFGVATVKDLSHGRQHPKVAQELDVEWDPYKEHLSFGQSCQVHPQHWLLSFLLGLWEGRRGAWHRVGDARKALRCGSRHCRRQNKQTFVCSGQGLGSKQWLLR